MSGTGGPVHMAVREGLLVLLADGPRYGYQLKTEWEAATGGMWKLNVGQIYSTLERLVRDGLVALEEADGQKLYTLTAAGMLHVKDWWGETPPTTPLPRDGLVVKILLAVRLGTGHALDVITQHRTALTTSLQVARRAMRDRSTDHDDGLARQLVDDALVTRTESDLRWLDQCEHRLIRSRDAAGGPSPA